MQLAGTKCAICEVKLVVAIEGTWCEECGSAYHVECLAGAAGRCTACDAEHTPPNESALLIAQGAPGDRGRPQYGSRVCAIFEIVAGFSLFFLSLLCAVFGSYGAVLAAFPVTCGALLIVDGCRQFAGGSQP